MENQQELPTIDQLIADMKPAAAASEAKVEAPVEEVAKAEEKVEAAAEAVEEVVEEAKVEEKPKDSFSKKFAAITRKEREVRQRQQEMDRRAKELEEKIRIAEEKEAKLAGIKKSPYKILKEMGVELQDVLHDSVNQYEAPKEDPVESKFSEMSKKLEELQTKLQSYEQLDSERQYQAAVQEVESAITETMSSNPEKYELSVQFGDDAVELAKEVMNEYYRQHGVVLDYSEVCDIVEQSYEQEVLDRLVKTKKVQSRLSSAAPAAAKSDKKPAPRKEADKPTTLSNQVHSTIKANVDVDKLDKDDALSLLSKQLKYLD